MSKAIDVIYKIIEEKGYITIDKFMQMAMTSHKSSYYISKTPIGANNDFITSPEISQLFGEIITLWCIDVWHKLGSPKNFNILEYGSGTGRLIQDMIRTSKIVKEFYDSMKIWIIDISKNLEKIQNENIKNDKVKWIDSINDIDKYPTIIIANEFCDALPIRQFQKNNDIWNERILKFDENKNLVFGIKELDSKNQKELSTIHKNAPNGAIFEKSEDSINFIYEISNHISLYKGAALIIDYGYDIDPQYRDKSQYKDTLQAIKNHKYIRVTDFIGEADLTSHIDFWQLKEVAKKHDLDTYGTISQREFLKSYGIDIRLEALINKNPEYALILKKQYNRLIDENQMGNLFKVMTIFSV